MIYDMHVHSTASDGTVSPEDIVNQAIELKLLGIALTDHDTVAGLPLAQDYIEKNQLNLDFIPGIEMNTEMDDKEIHILGYFIDSNNARLNARMQEIREQRRERAHKMLDRLAALGMKISYEQVLNLAGSDLIARPHIARALIEANYVHSIKEAFDKYIGHEKPAYVSRYKFSPDEAISMIKEAGGIAVLAHPGLMRDQKLLKIIIAMGIEGLEVYYPEHSGEQIRNYLRLAEEKQLLISGGSDYHGANSDESRSQLGSAGIDRKFMSKIKAYKNNI